MKRINREMNSLFKNNFLEGNHPLIDSKDAQLPTERFRLPTCEMRETKDTVIANFEIPGANKDHIELNVTSNEIEVKVESKDEQEAKDEKKGRYSYQSFSNQFYRRIPIGIDLDSDKAEASYHDGILKVEIPKKQIEEKKRKRIDIT